MRDPYRFLNVPYDIDEPALKARYRAFAKKLHADLGGSDEMMKLVNEAHDQILADIRSGTAPPVAPLLPDPSDAVGEEVVEVRDEAFPDLEADESHDSQAYEDDGDRESLDGIAEASGVAAAPAARRRPARLLLLGVVLLGLAGLAGLGSRSHHRPPDPAPLDSVQRDVPSPPAAPESAQPTFVLDAPPEPPAPETTKGLSRPDPARAVTP